MKVKEVCEIIERAAPLALAAEFDNSGKQTGDFDALFTGACVALDADETAVERCVKQGANLLITHHPLLFYPLKCVDFTHPVHRTLAKAIREGVSVYSAHTNADFAPNGVNDRFAKALGLRSVRPAFEGDLSSGRVGECDPITLGELVEKTCDVTRDRRVWALGKKENLIKRMLCVNGAGASETLLRFVAAGGADVFITSEWKYHLIKLANDLKCDIINVGHYESERFFLSWAEETLRSAGIEKIETIVQDVSYVTGGN